MGRIGRPVHASCPESKTIPVKVLHRAVRGVVTALGMAHFRGPQGMSGPERFAETTTTAFMDYGGEPRSVVTEALAPTIHGYEERNVRDPGSVAGIDIGSRSIELVVFDGGRPVRQVKVPTTYDPLVQCEKLLDGMRMTRVVATGYGRKLFIESFRGIEASSITEIQAYALGARYLFPEVRTVLDIGGQDTKVILLAPHGKVAKFEMNDRCAAGTGKFLEFMATALQIPLEAFGEFALRSDKRIQINSMCTVFA